MTHDTPGRRLVLAAAAAGAAAAWIGAPRALAATPPAANAPASFAYVGSFTSAQRQARGAGITVYRIDAKTGQWSLIQTVGDLLNPSFLILSRDQKFLYSVHGDGEYATAFAIDDKTGQARVLGRGATGGRNGVRQAIDPSGRFLVVANYSSGSVAVLPIGAEGGLSDQVQLIPLPGQPGPHKAEQTASHPHDIVFDPSGKWVVVPDKGLDRVFVFAFDSAAGRLTPSAQGSVQARSGAGPRHVAFHPTLPVAWVVNELDSTVTTYRWDAASGTLTPLQVATALPAAFTGDSTSAEIAVSPGGRFVYCSNRGHDSVSAFRSDPKTGALTLMGTEPTQGKIPRFVAFDPQHKTLYACNEQGDSIVAFKHDAGSGRLTPTGQLIKAASPVTIAFRQAAG
jgi:6-phosphogluconolactonase